MRHILSIGLIFLLTLISGSALAEGMHPSRARLLLHGSHELVKEQRKILFHFIPSSNLNAGIFPLTYLSLQERVTDWLTVVRLSRMVSWTGRTDAGLSL